MVIREYKEGFKNIEIHNWLRCFIEPQKAEYFLNHQKIGKIYGIDECIIKADCSRRKELSEYCYRIEEVRLYTIELE